MYYICKFSDTWSLYDASRQLSRSLDADEVNSLKKLFPQLLKDNKILTALQISTINPNKLLQLPSIDPNPAVKKINTTSTGM
ncbi:hypothetical protein CCY01nite_39690 [Chitinophaga cymbidii]|uniref:Uncharacterized protein n=1 Tax=Chitinophaga cymbidii TaxID=1096750 RepID=A0A512RPT5_9BACT|nr:hypothetical protein CCY01nite_39690 [Chitinophaga cymbidii]